MEVKGAVVKTIPDLIKSRYPDKYDAWMNALPPDSAVIFREFVKSADWYPFMSGMHIPTQKLGEVVYNGDILKAAWESGRYSAEVTLKGVYKFFVMAAPPSMVIKRGSRILATFYQPTELIINDEGDGWAQLYITKFDELTEVIENRIAGWIEKALEIQKIRNTSITIPQSAAKGDPVTELFIKWGKENH